MVKEELIRRSPLRALERSMQGGLDRGNVGVFASRKGVGKTACLVHIATDKLLQEKPVIHVSYSSRVDHILRWYEDLFKEIARRRKLEKAMEIHDALVRNRVVMNFKQDASRTEQVLKSIEAMIECGRFAAEAMIVDGYDFSSSTSGDLQKFKEFAGRSGLEMWFSASLRGEDPLFDEQGFPHELKGYAHLIDVVITLAFKENHVRLRLVKNRDHPAPGDLKIRLDPSSLLISE